MPQPANWTADFFQPQPGSDAALALGWTWLAARAASVDHKRGDFALSWQLWTDMDSLPAIRAAKGRRLASPSGLPWEVVGPTRAPGRLETEAAQDLWERHGRRLLKSTLSDIVGEGFSIWQHPATRRREVIAIERWPISQVRFTPTPFPDVWQPGKWIERYYAIQYGVGESLGAVMYGPQTLRPVPSGAYLPGGNGVWVRFIQLPRPGETDGHWTFVADPIGADQPHLSGAVTALDVPYVGGAIMSRSMYALSKTLGRQGILGKMPPETQVQGAAQQGQPADGLSPEGRAMRRTVAGFGLTEGEAVIPHEADIKAVEITGQTAGLFPSFAALNLRDVEMAILCHAGTTAKQDAQFVPKDGVETKVPQHLERADVRTIRNGFERLVNLLAMENAGVEGIELRDHLPNAEDDERLAAKQLRDKTEADKHKSAHAALYAERANGFDFPPTPEGQADLDALFARFGCRAPKIPAGGLPPVTVKLPPATTTLEPETAVTAPAGGPTSPPTAAPSPPA